MPDLNSLTLSPPRYGHGSGQMVSPGNFFDPTLFISRYYGDIPHWYQPGVMQFVTFRLNDSLPQTKLMEYEIVKQMWHESHPKPWSEGDLIEYALLLDKIDNWLDKGFGECLLKYSETQDIVENTLRYFDEKRYALFDYIIMPNHVHLMLIPGIQFDMKQIMQSLKSYTAKQINQLLGRRGKVWQKESWDRLIRSMMDYLSKKNYIVHNGDALK